MHIGLRLLVMGVFAAAGLSLAVAWALPAPADGEGAVGLADMSAALAAKPASVVSTAQAPKISGEVPGGTNPAAEPLPPSAPAPAIDPQALLDTALQRWTATHWPPVSRQFEQLDQMLKAVQRLEQASEKIAAPPPEPAPRTGPDQPAPPITTAPFVAPPAATPLDARTPEVALNAGRDLVSINALGSDIREVLKALSDAAGINILAAPGVSGTVSLSLTDVGVAEALSAILKSTGYGSRREGAFVFVGSVEDLQKMAVANDEVNTRVYRPNYTTAAELQKLITSLLTPGVGSVSVSTAAEIGIASNKDKAGGDAFAGSDVLVVRDFETVLRHIDQIYQEIDRMPMQVIIQAMILSVRLDDQNSLGVDFELLRDKNHIRIVSGTPIDNLANLNFDDGLKIGFLDNSLFALLDALETIGDTNVIASPRVTCLHKQRAEILIGSELGYISTTVTETAATQSVEFLEVGTHLKIRPFISQDGMVRLEVHPELSTGSVRVQQGFTLPDKDVTQVTTNVMCRSGTTVVIGGLIREDLITSAQQIPVLGNLPLVGALFRQRTEDTERREIIVLLTPRIVDESELLADGERALTQSRDRRNAFYDKMMPTNKRRISERYGRLALSAWTAGDADAALRYANLAIHFDPLHQDAINLRQNILAAFPHLEPTERSNLRYGLYPHQHPLRDYSAPAGWPWREIGPPLRDEAIPSMDAGQPGPVRHLYTDRP